MEKIAKKTINTLKENELKLRDGVTVSCRAFGERKFPLVGKLLGNKYKGGEYSTSNNSERMDIQRIRCGEVGPMKFVKLCAGGDLTYGDQISYWKKISVLNFKKFVQYWDEVDRLRLYNMTVHQFGTFSHSVRAAKREFEADQWKRIIETIKGSTRMRAQGFSWPLRVEVNHTHIISGMDHTSVLNTCSSMILKLSALGASLAVDSSWSQRCTSILQFVVSFEGANSILIHNGCKMMQALQSYNSNEFIAQAAQDKDQYESLFSSIVQVLAHSFGVSKHEDIIKDVVRTKKIENIAHLCSSSNTIISFLTKIFKAIMDAVEASARGCEISMLQLYRLNARIPEWMREVKEVYMDDGLFKSANDYNVAKIVKNKHSEGLEFLELAQRARLPAAQIAHFSSVLRLCTEMMRATVTFAGTDQLRPEPFVVYLHGDSGLGKSTLVQFLIARLLNDMRISFDRARDLYVRNPLQDHWDGYVNQTVTIFDDFMQSRDENDRIAEAMELIRIKNNMPYPLKMADLGSKGNTKFTSPLVIVTSNHDVTRDVNISSVDALRRRRDVVIEVGVKDQYLTLQKKINGDLVHQFLGKRISTEIYELKFRDKYTGELLFVKTFEEACTYMADLWNNLQNHEKMIEESVCTEFIAQSDVDEQTLSILEVMRARCTLEEARILLAKVRNQMSGLGTWSCIQIGTLSPIWQATLGVMSSLMLGIGFLAVTKKSDLDGESFTSGDSSTKTLKNKLVIRRKFKPQGSVDNVGLSLTRSVYSNAMCRVTIKHKGKSHTLNGILIGGYRVMVPGHLFILAGGDCEHISISTMRGTFAMDAGEVELYEVDEGDLTIFSIPSRFPMFPNLVHHFVRESDLGKYPISNACLVSLTGFGDKVVPLLQNVGRPHIVNTTSYSITEGSHEKITLARAIQYDCDTQSGDCGSLLVWQNASVQKKVLGFHVAGTQGKGMTTLISHEFLSGIIAELPDMPMVEQPVQSTDMMLNSVIAPAADLYMVAQVAREMAFRQPCVTSIVKSPLFDELGVHTTSPALLSPKDGINPWQNHVQSLATPPVILNEIYLNRVVKSYILSLLSLRDARQHQVLTIEQGVFGIDGDKWVRPLNLHTSPGYPWMFRSGKKGKFGFIEPLNKTISPELQKAVCDRIDLYKQGSVIDTMYVDVLKDERRSLEKVRSGKTRVFNTVPVDFGIVVRMYFLDFAAFLMDNNVFGESAVGINYHSRDWMFLMEKLNLREWNVIAGDYKNFDKTLPHQLVVAFVDVVNQWYGDDEVSQKVRKMIGVQLVSRFHLLYDMVYYQNRGNPSGNPMTAILNSVANSLLIRIAFLQLLDKQNRIAIFDDCVRCSVYGDDNIISVHPACTWFNAQSLQSELRSVGIVYTSSDKSEITCPYIPWEQVTFLKRKFLPYKGLVLAPLPRDVIIEMTNWIRKSNDDVMALKQNLVAALYELFHFGEKVYMTTYEEWIRILRVGRKMISLPDYTWDMFFRIWDGGQLNLELPSSDWCDLLDVSPTTKCYQSSGTFLDTVTGFLQVKQIKMVAQSITVDATALPQPDGEAHSSQLDSVFQAASEGVIQNQFPTKFIEAAISMPTEENRANEHEEFVTFPSPSLKEFLSRPIPVDSFTWTSAIAKGTVLASRILPNAFFRAPGIWAKLANFSYYRSGFKISLRLNGTKFHYGKLMVAWLPYSDDTVSNYLNLKSLSGFPHITVSPSQNEVRELVVPFIYPSYYYRMSTTKGSAVSMGHIVIMVMNSLKLTTSATSDIGVTLYVSAVDPQVDGPTGYPLPIPGFGASLVAPPGPKNGYSIQTSNNSFIGLGIWGGLTNADHSRNKVLTATRNFRWFDTIVPPTTFTAQAKTMADKAQVQELKKYSRGPMEEISTSVMAIGNSISRIPGGVGIGSLVSGAGSVASRVFSALGWCKPNNATPHTMVVNQAYNNAYGIGIDQGQKLSVVPINAVKPALEWLGSHPDEMNISYIAQTLTYVGSMSFSSAEDIGRILTLWPVCPGTIQVDKLESSTTFVKSLTGTPSMVGHLSSAFTYWTGSMRFLVQVVASSFHSGRLRISFEPILPEFNLTNRSLGVEQAINMVIDIQQDAEYSFEIPYIYGKPWARINEPIGILKIDVVNPLVTLNPNSNTIELNLWVGGGTSFRLALPTTQNLYAFFTLNSKNKESEQGEVMVAQGLSRDETRRGPFVMLGDGKLSEDNGLCMGEILENVKELTSRYSYMTDVIVDPLSSGKLPFISAFAAIKNGNQQIYSPVVRASIGIGLVAAPHSFIDWMRMIFRFTRGSVNYRMVVNAVATKADPASASTQISYAQDNGGLAGLVSTLDGIISPVQSMTLNEDQVRSYGNGSGMVLFPVSNALSVNVPYYTSVVAFPSVIDDINPRTPEKGYIYETPGLVLAPVSAVPTPQPQRWPSMVIHASVLASTGDDYSFGYMIGPPCREVGTFYYSTT